MTLTEFLDKIDETARAATQGPWEQVGELVCQTHETLPDAVSAILFRAEINCFNTDLRYISRMDPPTTLTLTAALRKCVEALELISGPSEWNCEIGEANQRAAAKIVLSSLSESFKEMK